MNRRSFLRTSSWATLAHLSGVSPLRSMSVYAQSSSLSDYKALICLFMRGGNDSNNMIVPMATADYSQYAAGRGPLALSQSSLLQLSGIGYGLHSSLPTLAASFRTGNAALIANVGPLVQPTTAAQYKMAHVSLPDALMSHEDQQQIWESGGYHSGVGPGWAGLAADSMSSSYNTDNLPMVTLLGNATNFGTGNNTSPLFVAGNTQPAHFWCSAGGSCGLRNTAQQQLLSFDTGVELIQQDQLVFEKSFKYSGFYNKVIQGVSPLKTSFPSSCALSPALQTISSIIQLRGQIGARRQIFLIDLGGFDTHASQLTTQAGLLGQVDQGVAIFTAAMQELGVYKDVTMFTASDFARTLQYNGSLGTDHAWGGHHFVVGGAVKGGQLYGKFPSMQINGPDDIDGSGRWAPSTSLSQYLATLATWFGVPTADLPKILPGLSNFGSSNVGFI